MNIKGSYEEHLLGFLSIYETNSNDGYIGSLLITDFQGIPQEFRCTHPIKPTAVQKVLYGDSLEPFIGVNLCGSSLLKSTQTVPSILIVDKNYLIDIRKITTFPVIYVRKAGETIDLSLSEGNKIGKRDRIDPPNSKSHPLIIISHPDFSDDLSVAKKILEKIFIILDPLEPFHRMLKAIEVLGKQDKIFK